MAVGSIWCHQMPERSPHIYGVQMPLCWRCSGIAIGMILIFVWLMVRKRLPSLMLSLLLVLPLPIDVFTAMAGFSEGHNGLRFSTGLLWGVFSVSVMFHLIQRFQARSRKREIVIAH
jgi:uncharacterized membrane protein